jgi:hypothetical protein
MAAAAGNIHYQHGMVWQGQQQQFGDESTKAKLPLH